MKGVKKFRPRTTLKEILSGALAGTVIVGGLGIAVHFFSDNTNNEVDSSYNIQLDKTKKGDRNVSLFNVGNAKVKGKSDIKDIRKANKYDVPAGIIINSIAEDRADIYKDVDYAKYLVQEADVDLVYLDVNNIMANESLRVDEVLSLISDFCSKLSTNKIYVGVAGTEENIAKLKEYDADQVLKAYDTYLTDNNLDLDTEKQVSRILYYDSEGNLKTNENIESMIDKKNLNRSKNFKFDTIYYPKESDTLADIAYRYGLSVDDLLEYNNLHYNEKIRDIKWLKIPTVISKSVVKEKKEKSDDSVKMGVDMSHHQGNVNWDKIENNCEFVILKVSEGTSKDNKFETYSKECMERGIPMGVYCYNGYYASNRNDMDNSEFEKLQEEQAHKFIEYIAGKNIDLPAYIDYEQIHYSPEKTLIMLQVWYKAMKNAGYTPGLYCDKSHYQECKKAFDEKYGKGSLDEKFNIWVAGDFTVNYQSEYNYSDHIRASENGTLPKPEDFASPKHNLYDADVIQITGRGSGFGAGNSKGYVDVDYTYMNLNNPSKKEKVTPLTEEEQEFLAITSPNQKTKIGYKIHEKLEDADSYVIAGTTGGAGILLGLGLAGLYERRRNDRITPKRKVFKRH